MSAVMEWPDKAGTILLRGELTIQHASRLKEVLLEGMKRSTHLAIDVEGVEEIDLSCLQVLCSAHRTAIASQKDLAIAGTWPECFRQAVEKSAFSSGKSCRSRKNETCLWNSGGCS